MTKTITNLHARQVIDSRGNPTVEVEVTLSDGSFGRAIVPSGASTGVHEALEMRDGDATRFMGKGVSNAVKNVNTFIKDEILNKEFSSYEELDKLMLELDGTENKSKLGANAILGVSMAFVVASAKSEGKWIYEYLNDGKGNILPRPMMNILNGGSHADNNVDIQEFMIIPWEAENFSEGLRRGTEIFHHLKKILKNKGLSTGVGDEGGYAPNLNSNEEALEVIMLAIDNAGYTGKIRLALDVAASEFYNKEEKNYNLEGEGKVLNAEQMIDLFESWIEKYPIVSIEDGLDEDDFTGRTLLNSRLGEKIMNVGDDLFVTNIKRLEMGIEQKMANAILIKLNQIGTVSETIQAVQMAHKYKMNAIISHRSGETEDTFIADLSVALNTGFIKTGSASRTDRIAKYNQLLRINERLADNAKFGK